MLIVREFSIPLGEFVADFDRPCHSVTIPYRVYIVKGILWEGVRMRGARPYTSSGSFNRTVVPVRWLFTAAAKRRIPSRICSGAALEKFKRMWREPS
jgi:hypothetical protein